MNLQVSWGKLVITIMLAGGYKIYFCKLIHYTVTSYVGTTILLCQKWLHAVVLCKQYIPKNMKKGLGFVLFRGLL